MVQFILKLLQAIVGKRQKQFYAFVYRLRIANLVRFQRRKIVLLLRGPRANEWRGQHAGSQEKKMYFEFHGCFSAGGVAACCSAGRWGKSILSSSSSMPIKSCRTICSGGLWPWGDTSNVSSTSRIPFRTCICSCR